MKKLLLFGALAFGLNAFGQVPSYVPTNGLLAWFPFNGNALDESFNGNNGTLVGGVALTNDRNNSINSAHNFDGQQLTYIDCGNDASFDLQNGASLTISAWVKPDGTGTFYGNEGVVSKASSTVNNIYGTYSISLLDGVPRFVVSNENGIPTWYSSAISSDTLQLNTWNHIVGVADFSNLELRIYVNGDLKNITPWGGTLHSGQQNLLIGCRFKNNFGNQYMYNFGGDIDDVALWNVVLNQCEIIDLYTSGMLGAGSQNGTTLTADQTGATYQWLDCDNNYAVINGETNQSYTPAVTGNYAVEVNMNGCIDTSACFLVDYTGIEELFQTEKELIKIIDFMGRETEIKPNTPLIFIYSDGTRERVMKIEE